MAWKECFVDNRGLKYYTRMCGKEKNTYYINDNDVLHCDKGPAVIFEDGTLQYWINGELHREDGPAIVIPAAAAHAPHDIVAYYINNQCLKPEAFRKWVLNKNLNLVNKE